MKKRTTNIETKHVTMQVKWLTSIGQRVLNSNKRRLLDEIMDDYFNVYVDFAGGICPETGYADVDIDKVYLETEKGSDGKYGELDLTHFINSDGVRELMFKIVNG